MTLTWSIFCYQENIVWSTRNPFSSFRINNCFCQIPLQSVFEVLLKLILDDFTFNKFVFRTRGSLLLSELRASSRIRHGGRTLSASHRKCILLSETECHIIKNLLTELARAVLGNIGPRSWQYGPSEANGKRCRPQNSVLGHTSIHRQKWGHVFFYIYPLLTTQLHIFLEKCNCTEPYPKRELHPS